MGLFSIANGWLKQSKTKQLPQKLVKCFKYLQNIWKTAEIQFHKTRINFNKTLPEHA